MSTKQNILNGEAVLKQIDDTLSALNDINKALGLKEELAPQGKAIKLLLSIQILEFETRQRTTTVRLNRLRQDYELEFEKESMEANSGIENAILVAKTFIGQEPKQITDLIPPLIQYYEKNVADLRQEERNNVYAKLKGHINFLKKTYKK